MGRSPYCKKKHTKKGAWNKKKDQRPINYNNIHGEGCWRSLPKAVGLLRCDKSCKLRWINYVPPDLKRVNITEREAELIIRLQSLLCNKWSLIAARLPGSTDKEIKDYWKTHLKRKLYNRGLDPQTHRPLDTPTTTATAANPVAFVNINDGSNNNNDGKFQNWNWNNISAASKSQVLANGKYVIPLLEMVDPHQFIVTRALDALKKEDAASANSISKSTNFSIWEKGERIGAGGYGTVYVARNRYI
ncbi:hypothetical protein K1719_001790 [Acacia pycnantha]|nr:hypothetical protein K1719_001790 [Acacia pycnantha]